MYPIKELGGKCNRKANYQISQAQDLAVTVLSRGGLDISSSIMIYEVQEITFLSRLSLSFVVTAMLILDLFS